MTYPFAGEIKMNKVIKDGQEMIEWEEVDMSLHSAGNLGIGTQPTGNICFFENHADNSTEVLRLSKDGILANPDIPVDEAAKLVLAAMEWNIKVLLDKAVADERNATLDEIADKIGKMPFGDTAASFAVWIREQKT
jgi:hypothetical protein